MILVTAIVVITETIEDPVASTFLTKSSLINLLIVKFSSEIIIEIIGIMNKKSRGASSSIPAGFP